MELDGTDTPVVPWRHTPVGKATESMVLASANASRKTVRALVILHVILIACVVAFAIMVYVTTRKTLPEHAHFGRVVAETLIAIAILCALPLVRISQTTNLLRSTGAGKPAPAAGLLLRLTDYWTALALVIGVWAVIDLLISLLSLLRSILKGVGY